MDLENLRHKRDYYKHTAPDWVRNVFRNYNSFDWFCKDMPTYKRRMDQYNEMFTLRPIGSSAGAANARM